MKNKNDNGIIGLFLVSVFLLVGCINNLPFVFWDYKKFTSQKYYFYDRYSKDDTVKSYRIRRIKAMDIDKINIKTYNDDLKLVANNIYKISDKGINIQKSEIFEYDADGNQFNIIKEVRSHLKYPLNDTTIESITMWKSRIKDILVKKKFAIDSVQAGQVYFNGENYSTLIYFWTTTMVFRNSVSMKDEFWLKSQGSTHFAEGIGLIREEYMYNGKKYIEQLTNVSNSMSFNDL